MELLLPKQIRLGVMNYDESFKTAFCRIAEGETFREIKTRTSFTIKLMLSQTDSNECSALISCSWKKAILRNISAKTLELRRIVLQKITPRCWKQLFTRKASILWSRVLRCLNLTRHNKTAFSSEKSSSVESSLKFRMNWSWQRLGMKNVLCSTSENARGWRETMYSDVCLLRFKHKISHHLW